MSHNISVFGDRIFKEAIKLKSGIGVALMTDVFIRREN